MRGYGWGGIAIGRNSYGIPPCDNLCPNVVQINRKIGTRLKLQTAKMEALTAVQVSLLTIYDMCKAVDRGMVMSDVKLLEKSGGKSGEWKTKEIRP